jgi:hypothetical protein
MWLATSLGRVLLPKAANTKSPQHPTISFSDNNPHATFPYSTMGHPLRQKIIDVPHGKFPALGKTTFVGYFVRYFQLSRCGIGNCIR